MRPILLHGILHVILAAQERLDDNIISPRPKKIHIYSNLLEMSAESSERPLVPKVVLLTIFILDEFFVFLVDAVVCQMHVFVVLVDL